MMKYFTLLLGLLIGCLCFEAFAASFDIIVVQASREGAGFSSALAPYKEQLSNMGYNSGNVISNRGFNLVIGKAGKFNVAGDISAQITLTKIDDGFIHFEFKMFQGDNMIVKMGYRIPDGKHTIISGPSSKNNKYIIIIRASE